MNHSLAFRDARVVFIRHGESLHNVDPSLYDLHLDEVFGLTSDGVRQAEQTGNILTAMFQEHPRKLRFWHSGQIRALQTAAVVRTILSRETGEKFPTQSFDGLMEFYVNSTGHKFEGFDFDEFLKNPLLTYQTADKTATTRCIREMVHQTDKFVLSLHDKPDDALNIVISHHFPISAAMYAWRHPSHAEENPLDVAKEVVNAKVDHCKPYFMIK